MFDIVRIGEKKIIGEIIEIHDELAFIQAYEETSGLGPGAIVESTGVPLSIELGPGLIGEIFDGIGRPLNTIMKKVGNNLEKGVDAVSLNRKKKWTFSPNVQISDIVSSGDVLGYVKETSSVIHKIMVPNGVSGTITEVKEGEFFVDETVIVLKDRSDNKIDIKIMHRWPVRVGRPFKEKLSPNTPMITGQRTIDTLFPIARGGVAAVPGPFGSGKTVVQHQLAKWVEADIVVYIGCGERGNEMTDVLNEFPSIVDPKTGKSLMERTVLIANTSDMPVAAREASIYTGITIAEYFRDMGYSVALMADSTSRWAEALREISGRLEEMPGEEGYPAYLGSRLSSFYERAGIVKIIGREDFSKIENRTGILTVIGAVSPPGGDISEPVSQATLRIVRVFWCLDSTLAYRRHFPALNWLASYSLYVDEFAYWYETNISSDWPILRNQMLELLVEEAKLEEIVKLVGVDALSGQDRIKLETAKSIREDFLHQNAFHKIDTFTSLKKQYFMMKLILEFYDNALLALKKGAEISKIISIGVRESISRFKYVRENAIDAVYNEVSRNIDHALSATFNEENQTYA
jgi:V/A-type H+-transporting ATPase subunit A